MGDHVLGVKFPGGNHPGVHHLEVKRPGVNHTGVKRLIPFVC